MEINLPTTPPGYHFKQTLEKVRYNCCRDGRVGSERGAIYIYREHHGSLQGQCGICQEWTAIDFGQITGGCPHIDVKFLDDDGGGA